MFLARSLLSAAVAAAVVLGSALWAAEPASTQAQNAGLAGQLLVATSELEDPRFTRTVIYMVRHDARTGAMGLVVNRQLGEVPMAVLLKQSGLPSAGAKGSVRLHVGGPVEATRIVVLHTDDYAGPDTVKVANGVAVTAEPSILQSIAEGRGPRRARFTLGYAGWAPGQLEAEMEAGYWIVVPSDDAIVFDDAYETKWDRAMARRRINL
ncbi:MAG: YqgE/AlgH family protein [Candidatus Rokubacteria bacterium]|nr:YqgE/AlgH family protein [Candidatus Rokubacteria bacterium]